LGPEDDEDYDWEDEDMAAGEFRDEDEDDRSEFADPGGNSALRAETRDNPRNLPCPKCGAEDVLTPADVARHYVCDHCADATERGY
jgi:predicted RNA-binding Zn-ribbon protein involved in translation (DUF1610 family)